jgi:hypothetical protein
MKVVVSSSVVPVVSRAGPTITDRNDRNSSEFTRRYTECQGDCADLRIPIITKRLTPFTHCTLDAPWHHINSG